MFSLEMQAYIMEGQANGEGISSSRKEQKIILELILASWPFVLGQIF